VLQPDSLKLELYEFNIIINILNIILGLSVATRLKTFKYICTKRHNTLRS